MTHVSLGPLLISNEVIYENHHFRPHTISLVSHDIIPFRCGIVVISQMDSNDTNNARKCGREMGTKLSYFHFWT